MKKSSNSTWNLKGPKEIEILHAGGRCLAQIIAVLAAAVRPGLATKTLEVLAREQIAAAGGKPAFLNYQPAGAERPFPSALCVSVNDEVVHGIPSERILLEGDIITLDLGLEYQKMFTDMAVTVPVGQINVEARKLIDVTTEALTRGIRAARVGQTLGDIGFAVESFVRPQGFDLVREFGGHGVGFSVHEEPEVSNCGIAGTGEKLVAGLVIAIEPMVTIGRAAITIARDGYTVKTRDGRLAAHFEHTVAITESGPEILTPLEIRPLTGLTKI